MERVYGVAELKSHLSEALDQVARGETVVVTRHGKPVAELRPSQSSDKASRLRAIEGLNKLREGLSLGGLNWREMRDKGRP